MSRLEPLVLSLHLAALALALAPPVFFAAVVAPALFHGLPTLDMAASVVSPVLTKMCGLAEASFGVLFGTAWLLTSRGAPRLSRSLLTRLPVLGFFSALVIRQLLIPPMDRIRAEAPGLIDNLPVTDPSRAMLDRYHRLATGFFGIELAAALILLLATARLLAARRAEPPPPPAAPRPVQPQPRVLNLD
jgi:ABC-type transport system involved in cytochrome c biogenesis permease subunit